MAKAKVVPTEETPKNVSYELRAIYIRNSSIALEQDFNPLLSGQELSAAFECKQDGCITSVFPQNEGAIEVIQSVTCVNRYDFSYFLAGQEEPGTSTKAPSQKLAASITAHICVNYVVSAGRPTPEDLAGIANSSIFHSWPYWREYCHSNMMRMQLPIIQVPLLHLQTLEQIADQPAP